ncbi:MAG: alpha/beta fold hydrolase [Pseudomonadota bacterium]
MRVEAAMRALVFATGLLICASQPGFASCGSAGEACETTLGSYHIELPENAPDAPLLVFLHGYGSSGANAISLQQMVKPALARGYAVIAPNGLPRSTDGEGPASWNFFPGWSGRDETAFLNEVVADAAGRFGVSTDRVMLSGFSAGAFMVNYLACAAPETFAAYAPVSGGFWRPHPDSCDGPVRLLHTHGWADPTVPLEGRKLGGGRFQQGDIFQGLEIWRNANGCDDERPTAFNQKGDVLTRLWEGCAPGSQLQLALFPGGHTVPAGWTDMALDWFEDQMR